MVFPWHPAGDSLRHFFVLIAGGTVPQVAEHSDHSLHSVRVSEIKQKMVHLRICLSSLRKKEFPFEQTYSA